MASLPQTQKVVLIDSTSESYEPIKYTEIATPKIESPDDVIIKNYYSGVNFIEAYFRKGWYPVQLPFVPGREASGEVVAVGSNVTEYSPGDKVVYLSNNTFAQYTKIKQSLPQVHKLSKDVTDTQLKVFGSFSVKALTAYSFVDRAYKPQKGDNILVWAAAGGVGQILVQIISRAGANVIAVASTADKLELTKKLGAKYTINYKTEDVAAKVQEYTNGEGVMASFDSVGKASYESSIKSLGVGGILISYGNSSGKVPPVDIYALALKCLKITRGTVTTFVAKKPDYERYISQVIDDVTSGKLVIDEPKEYPMGQYKEVAQLLESGSTTGQFVLKID